MYDSKVIVREYHDGAVSVHARKDDAGCSVQAHEMMGHSRLDVNSPVYERLRSGSLVHVYVHTSHLSRAEAQRGKQLLEASFQRQGVELVPTIR